MTINQDFQSAEAVSNWLDVAPARSKLRTYIDAFLSAAVQFDPIHEEDAPALALAVSAGLGKTQTTLRLLGEHGAALLEKGHILFYVPTLDLAEKADAEFRALGTGLPHMVLRGRSARDPSSGGTMCQRAEFAKEIAPFVSSITDALCRRRVDNEIRNADCAAGCAYLRQAETTGHRIVFLSHEYLAAGLPLKGDVALRVIDEKFWSKLTQIQSLDLTDWIAQPDDSLGAGLRRVHDRVRTTVLLALRDKRPVLEDLRTSGIDAAILGEMAESERSAISNLQIAPWQIETNQHRLLSLFDSAGRARRVRLANIFDLLAENMVAGRATTERLTLETKKSHEHSICVLKTFRLKDVQRDAPTLILDADADPLILERLLPGCRYVSIEARPRADVVQVTDKTVADSWLNDPCRGPGRAHKILTMVANEVTRAQGKGALLVATKSTLRALHSAVGHKFHVGDDGLREPLMGAETRWFGPGLQGINDYKNYATIIVVGRRQPPVSAFEDPMRCLFGDTEYALTFAPAERLENGKSVRLLADGSRRESACQVHPDSRGQALVEQMRERDSLQAIARLRLLDPNLDKRVVLIGSLPLPGLPISRVCCFGALAAGCENQDDWHGFQRLRKALTADNGGPVLGTQLSRQGLHLDLSRDFPTVNSAAEFRKHRSTRTMGKLIHDVCASEQWPVTPIHLSRTGKGGKPIPAVMFCRSTDALPLAAQFWPDMAARIVAWGDL
jgi:hypothetical protein